MNKGIIVVNKVPDKCSNCIFSLALREESKEGYYCALSDEENPPTCPIKPLPQADNGLDEEYKDGWNACLNKIEKEKYIICSD